jgi:hypothetical protein
MSIEQTCRELCVRYGHKKYAIMSYEVEGGKAVTLPPREENGYANILLCVYGKIINHGKRKKDKAVCYMKIDETSFGHIMCDHSEMVPLKKDEWVLLYPLKEKDHLACNFINIETQILNDPVNIEAIIQAATAEGEHPDDYVYKKEKYAEICGKDAMKRIDLNNLHIYTTAKQLELKIGFVNYSS